MTLPLGKRTSQGVSPCGHSACMQWEPPEVLARNGREQVSGRAGARFKHLGEEVALEGLLLGDDTLGVGTLPELVGAAGQALHCAAGLPGQLKQPRQLLPAAHANMHNQPPTYG